MTLEYSGFTNKELLCNMPDSFKAVLKKVWLQHYEELYEPETDGTTSLSHALNEILELFKDSNQTLTHARYVWMALILALVVEPTIKYYQPSNSIPEKVIEQITFWLSKNLANTFESEKYFTSVTNKNELDIIVNQINHSSNFNDSKLSSFQIWNEALDVYSNTIRTLDFNQSLEALLEILDDCLEGYAIFPGSQGRRKLFDWWLLEVVPASWFLLPPGSIYTIDNLANRDSIVISQMKTLKSISSAIWSILAESELSTRLFRFDDDNHLSVTPAPSVRRVGWNEAFTKMAEKKDDILLDNFDTTSWDNVEWKW
jgi:hypothetical protein